MAQSYQDITGQIIYKVITLVEDVESSLVDLIKLSSKHLGVEATTSKDINTGKMSNTGKESKKKDKNSLDGPVVPGVADEKETLSGQDEVDDLLSSLGF